MANFLSQSQRYDGPAVESNILDLQEELEDEIAARATLDTTSADKIAAAEEFLSVNSSHVESQLTRLTAVDTQIRDLVAENTALEASDAEYAALIASAPYVKIADDIASLYAISENLDNFLVQKGRKGRPPMN